jgi:hypothetical protein
MNEDLIRSLVREALARRLGGDAGAASAGAPDSDGPLHPVSYVGHSSHYRYTLPESTGPCVIEPGVRCTHCGYCESHGH